MYVYKADHEFDHGSNLQKSYKEAKKSNETDFLGDVFHSLILQIFFLWNFLYFLIGYYKQ